VLTNLHNAIVAHLLANVAGVQSCEGYPELDGDAGIKIPGILIETDSTIEPGINDGTERLCLTTRWRAYCLYDPNSPNADLEVRNFAITVALTIFLASRFGQPVQPAKITFIGEDGFKPELDSYLVWVVEWEHGICVGDSVWDGAGVLPTELNVSFNDEPHRQIS